MKAQEATGTPFYECADEEYVLDSLQWRAEIEAKIPTMVRGGIRLRRDYGVVMNHELIGQWFPLCGTVLDHQMTQTVGFDIIQLLVVCLLTAFCGMPRHCLG